MKRFLLVYLVPSLLILPMVLAFVDMYFYFMTGHKMTNIEWDSMRPILAIFFFGIGVLIAVIAEEIFE